MTTFEEFKSKVEITIENSKNEYKKCLQFILNKENDPNKLFNSLENVFENVDQDNYVIKSYNTNTLTLKDELYNQLRVFYKTNTIIDSSFTKEWDYIENEFKKYFFDFHTIVKTMYFEKYKHVKYITFYDYFYNVFNEPYKNLSKINV